MRFVEMPVHARKASDQHVDTVEQSGGEISNVMVISFTAPPLHPAYSNVMDSRLGPYRFHPLLSRYTFASIALNAVRLSDRSLDVNLGKRQITGTNEGRSLLIEAEEP